MGQEIDQLNFKVILDDNDFDRKIKEDIRRARDFNTSVSGYLNIRNKEMGVIRKEVQEEENLTKELQKHQSQAEKNLSVHKRTGTQIEEQGKRMKELTGIFERYVSLWGAGHLVQSIARVTGEFEMQRQALRSMLGDIDGADGIFSKFKGLALQSPFTFMDLTKYAKQLTAFSIPMDELYDTTKMLADVSAGLGVSMDRIILAYGQVRAATVLRGQELRQFTEAGIPILDILARKLSEVEGKLVSSGEVFDRVPKRQVSFDMVKDAFIEMTSEGGKFYNMQEVLSETVAGKVMKLKDAYQILLNEIGERTSGVMKGVLDAVTGLMRDSGNLLSIIKDVVVAFGVYKVALFAMVNHINIARAATIEFAKIQRALSATFLANPYAIAAAAIAALAYATIRAVGPTKEMSAANSRLNKSFSESEKSVDRELKALDDLNDKLKSTKMGTDEWKSAKAQVLSQYGQYFKGLSNEIDMVGSLDGAYVKLTESITNAVNARKYNEFIDNEASAYENVEKEEMAKILSTLYDKLDRQVARQVYAELRQAVKDGMNPSLIVKDILGDKYLGTIHDMGARGKINSALNAIYAQKKAYDAVLEKALDLYDLRGTEYDPDFVGPTRKKAATGGIIPPEYDPVVDLKQREKDIKAQIELLKEMDEVYRQLSDTKYGFSDEEKESFMMRFFPDNADMVKAGNYTEKVKGLIEELKKYDAEDARRLDSTTGKDAANRFFKDKDKEIDALEKYNDAVAKWQAKVKEYDEDNFEVSKILGDYGSALKEVNLELAKNISLANEAKQPVDEFTALAKAEKDALGVIYRNKLKDYFSNAYIKDKTKGMDFSDWGDKSIEQVRGMLRELKKLLAEDPQFSDELKAKAAELGISLEDYGTNIKEGLQGLIDKVLPELVKKNLEAVKYVFKVLGAMLGDIQKFGEATGRYNLAATAEGIQEVSSIIKDMAEGYKKFGVIGAAVNIFAGMVKGMMKGAEAVEAFRQQLVSLREEARKARLESALTEGVESIFGSDDMKKVENAVKLAGRLRSEMAKLQSSAPKSFKVGKSFWEAYVGNGRFKDKYSLQQLADSVGLDLYDRNGIFNPDTLRTILETYPKLDKASKEWITQAMNDAEVYNKAMGEVESVMNSLFGRIADNIADKLVDSWAEARNAALDYADILDDVARAYAKMVIKSTIKDRFFDEDKALEVANMFMAGKNDEAMSAIASALEAVAGSAPVLEQILSAFDPYFNREDAASGGLSSGIKSITEEQAGLIASYMNAMRADLSVMRVLATQGWQDVKSILGMMPSPTVWDNIARIEANTYETMLSSRSILTEMQSVIGGIGSAGASSLKVEIVS